ncbi:hypothetical protein L596_029115 [Steinernema carpocapsae]|uniref:Uncharacterized protein n=1 Tax=Steinernema carpocapsae TaxID=34508 RepID=A0A4U5LTP1_STECR|nr:hypothetical protein L596_029115 [Steinernema carpocapsae]
MNWLHKSSFSENESKSVQSLSHSSILADPVLHFSTLAIQCSIFKQTHFAVVKFSPKAFFPPLFSQSADLFLLETPLYFLFLSTLLKSSYLYSLKVILYFQKMNPKLLTLLFLLYLSSVVVSLMPKMMADTGRIRSLGSRRIQRDVSKVEKRGTAPLLVKDFRQGTVNPILIHN